MKRPSDPSFAQLACWCGSSEHRLCWRTARFGLTRCVSCGCYRIDPPPVADESACEAFYNSYYQQRRAPNTAPDSRPHGSSRFWDVVAHEPSLLEVEDAAADIGCGEGQLCAELSQHGWKTVMGFDVAVPRIRRARELHPDLQFYDQPLASTDVSLRSLELMVMDNVIEHLPDPLAMTRGLGRYLAPGGRFVIITPNMESGHFRLLGSRWTSELAPHAHIYLFTPPSLERLIGEAGLHVEKTGSFHQPGLPLPDMLSRLARGDLKGAAWRAMQDAGGLYGRMLGAGSMLYAIATVAGAVDQPASSPARVSILSQPSTASSAPATN